MVARSTWIILIGVILLFWPVPPLLTSAVGAAVIILGVALQFLDTGDE